MKGTTRSLHALSPTQSNRGRLSCLIRRVRPKSTLVTYRSGPDLCDGYVTGERRPSLKAVKTGPLNADIREVSKNASGLSLCDGYVIQDRFRTCGRWRGLRSRSHVSGICVSK